MPTDPIRFQPILSVLTLENDANFQMFLSQDNHGVHFVPEPHADGENASLPSDAGDLAKWVRQHAPEIPLYMPDNTPKLVLRGADVWLPLVFLASDVSVQVFLNMAASYLYDKAKAGLKSDHPPRLHMRAVYEDKKTGKTKKFEFAGDGESLAKAIKRFDLNNFFDESP